MPAARSMRGTQLAGNSDPLDAALGRGRRGAVVSSVHAGARNTTHGANDRICHQEAAQRDRQDRPRDYANGYRAAAAAGPDNRLAFLVIELLAFYKPCSRTGTALYVIIGAMSCRFLHGL